MKSLIAVLALTVSANVFAYSIADSTVLTSASPFLTSATTLSGLKAEANQVINDAQNLMQSGEASAFLAEKIKLVQASDDSIADMEAVEILIEDAQVILAE